MSTNPDDAQRLVLPIGQRLGALYHSDDPDDRVERLRVGTEVVRLSPELFSVWELAHGDPETILENRWTVEKLTEVASAGVDDVPSALAQLVDQRVAVVVADNLDAYLTFGRGHRIVPTMMGLGNSSADPGTFGIGLLNTPLVTVNALFYDLYEWAHLDGDLWTACQNSAALNRRLGITDPVAVDADLLLGKLVDQMHGYLAPGAAYLDERRP